MKPEDVVRIGLDIFEDAMPCGCLLEPGHDGPCVENENEYRERQRERGDDQC